jgi:hypothetical protein
MALIAGAMSVVFLAFFPLLPAILRVPSEMAYTVVAVTLVFFAGAIARYFVEDRNIVAKYAAAFTVQVLGAAVIAAIVVTHARWSFLTSTIGLIAIVQFGAWAVEYYRLHVLTKTEAARLVRLTSHGSRHFAQSLESRSKTYVGLLIGMYGACLFALILGVRGQAAGRMALHGALIGASVYLLIELIRNGIRMVDPLYEAQFSSGAPSVRRIRQARRRDAIVEVVDATSVEDRTARIQDVGVTLTDLRKTILWSSIYASTVFVALLAIELRLVGWLLSIWWVLTLALIVFLMAWQLPYVVGQTLTQERLLDGFEGVQREELRERLLKYAPVFPKLEALKALVASSTAGGLLFLMIEKALKGVLVGSD